MSTESAADTTAAAQAPQPAPPSSSEAPGQGPAPTQTAHVGQGEAPDDGQDTAPPPAAAETAQPETETAEGAPADAAPSEEPEPESGSESGPESDSGDSPGTDAGDAAKAGDRSDAEIELEAQQELRRRIEQRKAEKQGPIAAGTKLSGTAAELLAAVRAVESGSEPSGGVFDAPATAPRRPAPEPERAPRPAPVAAPAGPQAQTVDGVRGVLTEGGAPTALAAAAAETLGESAEAELRDDPWQLLRVAGVRPEQADGFARALLGPDCAPDDERRGRAVTVWLLEQAALAGHTALDSAALTTALERCSVPDPDAAVQSAIVEGDVLIFQDPLDAAPGAPAPAVPEGTEDAEGEEAEAERPVRILVGLERFALAEESLADGLARIAGSAVQEDGPTAAQWESAAADAPRSAAELIRAVAGHGLVLHSGAETARGEPAALITAARALGLRVCGAAHTTDGRSRLAAQLAGDRGETPGPDAAAPSEAVTVAGLLGGGEGPGWDAQGALAVDLLVVLDAPQLDVESAAILVESLPDGARLVLSGDPGVLWSAGAGRVFADLLAARVCPQIVSRTPDPGPIGELVSGIGVGELSQVEAPGREVVIVPVRDAGEAVHRTVQLVADSVPRAIGVPADGTLVITPGHGGAAGTRVLNAALKERLNPGPGRFGGFDPGDRVAYSPAPGRTVLGRAVGADAEGLRLECDDAPVLVPKERVEQVVRHGWALTAHQAVGLRRPAAVVVLPGDAVPALTRAWVYTAFGRGERHLSVVHGVDQALPRAVAEIPAKERTTRLPHLLKAQAQPTA